MVDHNLSERQVSEMLDRTPMTVRIWRCQSEESKCIPAHMLELLKIKIWQAKAIVEGIAEADARHLAPIREVKLNWQLRP